MNLPTFPDSRPITNAREILANVSEEYGVSVDDLTSETRLRPIAIARQEVYLRMDEAGLSVPLISLLMGRDRATVHTGIRRAQERRAS